MGSVVDPTGTATDDAGAPRRPAADDFDLQPPPTRVATMTTTVAAIECREGMVGASGKGTGKEFWEIFLVGATGSNVSKNKISLPPNLPVQRSDRRSRPATREKAN